MMLDIGDPVDMHGADFPHSKRDLGDHEVVLGAGTDGADLQIDAVESGDHCPAAQPARSSSPAPVF
jgi:hypothetical protein